MAISYKSSIGKEDIKWWDGKDTTFTRETSTGGTVTLTKYGHMVDVAHVYGNGSINADILSKAIKNVGNNTVTFLITPGTWTIDSNLTIPSNCAIYMPQGAIFNISSGVTLTINSFFQAGLYQVFSGDGNVSFGSSSITEVYPEWWGAKGDGVTDDTTAIQKASNSFTLIKFSDGVYKVTNTITLQDNTTIYGIKNSQLKLSGTFSTKTPLINCGNYCVIKDLNFTAATNTSYSYNSQTVYYISNGVAISASNSDYVTIDNVYIEKYDYGIDCSGCSNITVTSSVILDSCYCMASFYMCEYVLFSNNICKRSSANAGVQFSSSRHIIVSNNNIEAYLSTGINPGSSYSVPAYDFVITDNEVTAYNCIALENGISDAVIDGNICYVTALFPDGVGIGVDRHVSSSCSAQNNIVISNNFIRHVDWLPSDNSYQYAYGIKINTSTGAPGGTDVNNMENIIISNNIALCPARGIYINNNGNQCYRVIIKNNIFTNVSGGIDVQDIHGTIANNIITHFGDVITSGTFGIYCYNSTIYCIENRIGAMYGSFPGAAYCNYNSTMYIIRPFYEYKPGDTNSGIFYQESGTVYTFLDEYYSTSTISGSFITGSKIYNSEPIAGEYVGWVYTTSGWKTFGAIST